MSFNVPADSPQRLRQEICVLSLYIYVYQQIHIHLSRHGNRCRKMREGVRVLNLSSQVHGSKHYESPLLQDPNMDKKHTDTHILEVEHRQSELKRTHL